MILATIQISPLAIAWGMLFFNIFVYFVNSYPNKKNIDYSYKDQIRDVAPNILLALAMAAVVYLVGCFDINIYISVILQVFVGLAFFLPLSYFLKNDSLFYIIDYIKEYRRNKSLKDGNA